MEAGCDLAQGWYFARPMPFPELLMWLEHGDFPVSGSLSSA